MDIRVRDLGRPHGIGIRDADLRDVRLPGAGNARLRTHEIRAQVERRGRVRRHDRQRSEVQVRGLFLGGINDRAREVRSEQLLCEVVGAKQQRGRRGVLVALQRREADGRGGHQHHA